MGKTFESLFEKLIVVLCVLNHSLISLCISYSLDDTYKHMVNCYASSSARLIVWKNSKEKYPFEFEKFRYINWINQIRFHRHKHTHTLETHQYCTSYEHNPGDIRESKLLLHSVFPWFDWNTGFDLSRSNAIEKTAKTKTYCN